MGPSGRSTHMIGLYRTVWDRLCRYCIWVELPVQRRLCSIFLKWCRVTRHPLVLRGLTGSQRTPGIGVSHVQQPMQQTHSGRLIRKPTKYSLLGETYQVVLDNPDDDPTTYEEALEDVDVQEWKKAMDCEMESMGSNSVWSLVEAPKGVKPIGCKWIYKRKRGPDGKVETFKARLVAKGYTQKEGIDYDETFSPVAMLKSVQILLAIAAALNYEI